MPEELYGRSPPLSSRSLNAALISLAMGQDGRRSEIILGQAYISGGDATLIKSVAHRVWRTKETQRGRIEGEEKKRCPLCLDERVSRRRKSDSPVFDSMEKRRSEKIALVMVNSNVSEESRGWLSLNGIHPFFPFS